MKVKFNLSLLINLIIVGYTGFLVVTAVFTFESGDPKTGTTDISENNLKPIYPEIPDSLSHRRYTELQDSVMRIRRFQNRIDGSGWNVALGRLLNTSKLSFCDTCTLKTLESSSWQYNKSQDRYFIKLLSWKIKAAIGNWAFPDSVQYYVHLGQPFISKETVFPQRDKPNHFIARMTDEPVKYWYNEKDDCIMIPVAKSIMQIVRVFILIIAIVCSLYFLWLFVSCLHFILDLSKGLAFTTDNVERLQYLALTLLFYPLAIFVGNLLLKWVFNSYFNEDVVLNNNIWFDSRSIMASGIITWFLYKAFGQGKQLKDDHDLTV